MKVEENDKSQIGYLQELERLRWGKITVCPYCADVNCSSIPSEARYHCNSCHTSFSVTVGTVFHNSRVPLAKWLQAIKLLSESRTYISARRLAQEINVHKDTANRMANRIRQYWHVTEHRLLMMNFTRKMGNKNDE